MAEDYLHRFMFGNLPVKGSLVRLSESWREVMSLARPSVSVLSILGETLCASALLTSNIKFHGSVSLQIQSEGSMRLLLGQCTNEGRVRGVVRMRQEKSAPVLDHCVLAINLEPHTDGVLYQGIVEMDKRGLVPTLERYFLQSEQLATRFWLVADSSRCSGLMLQKMPATSPDPDGWNRLVHLAASVSASELQTCDSTRLIGSLFHQEAVRLFSASDISFGCSCSKSRVSGMLHSLGCEEIVGLVEERGLVDVRCEYCGRNYQFDRVDVDRIFSGQYECALSSSGIH